MTRKRFTVHLIAAAVVDIPEVSLEEVAASQEEVVTQAEVIASKSVYRKLINAQLDYYGELSIFLLY